MHPRTALVRAYHQVPLNGQKASRKVHFSIGNATVKNESTTIHFADACVPLGLTTYPTPLLIHAIAVVFAARLQPSAYKEAACKLTLFRSPGSKATAQCQILRSITKEPSFITKILALLLALRATPQYS